MKKIERIKKEVENLVNSLERLDEMQGVRITDSEYITAVHETCRNSIYNIGSDETKKFNISSLSYAERLACVIGCTTETAEEMLNFKSSMRLDGMSKEELMCLFGLTEKQAEKTVCMFSITKIYAASNDNNKNYLKDSEEAAKKFREFHKEDGCEHFYLMSLNIKGAIIAIDEVSSGTLSACNVEFRKIFRTLISRNAAAFIICHNHPSGDSTESENDKVLTKRLAASAEIMSIRLMDHIILGNGEHNSLKAIGVID